MSLTTGVRQSKHLPMVPSRELPKRYVRIPIRLLEQAAYDGRLVGLYALIARQYLARKIPIPLSSSDVVRFDPSLSRGAAQRLLARLSAEGWVAETATAGKKSTYIPSWGMVHGAPLVWSLGTACLGRPRHVRAVALDLQLLDILMGKLTPHATRGAIVTRYVTAPAISLADVGAYALALAGLPAVSSRLHAWDILVDQVPQPLLETAPLLARISQATLFGETQATLSAGGARTLGVATSSKSSVVGQTLFFMPPELIGDRSGPWNTSLIDATDTHHGEASAVECAETPHTRDVQGITWEEKETKETHDPPTSTGGGGINASSKTLSSTHRTAPRRTSYAAPALTIPKTPSVALLQTLNVRPKALVRHAETPLPRIRAAIADMRMRPYVKDEAAWVVALLDDAHQHGWEIPATTTPAFVASPEERQSMPITSCTETTAPALDALVEQEALDSVDLTAHVRTELRWRVPDRTARVVSEVLLVQETPSVITVVCAKPPHVRVFNEQLRLTVQSVLADCGRTQALRIVVAQGARATADDVKSPCPLWIDDNLWSALPVLLRATLAGSTLGKHGVEAASPRLQATLHARYAAEVAALVERASVGKYSGNPKES